MECQKNTAVRGEHGGCERRCHTGTSESSCGSEVRRTIVPGQGNGTSSAGRRIRQQVSDRNAQEEEGRVDGDAQAGRPNLDSGAGNGRVYYENGAKRDSIPERFDLIPMAALRECAVVMSEGASRYGDNNWRGLPIREMLNHGMRHLVLYMSGDRSEPHLSHAACNLLMAMEVAGD